MQHVTRELVQLASRTTGAQVPTVHKWLAGFRVRGAAGRALDAFFGKRGIVQPRITSP